MINLESFKKKYCFMCGTQRCDPDDIEWREGCLIWRDLVNKEENKKNDSGNNR